MPVSMGRHRIALLRARASSALSGDSQAGVCVPHRALIRAPKPRRRGSLGLEKFRGDLWETQLLNWASCQYL